MHIVIYASWTASQESAAMTVTSSGLLRRRSVSDSYPRSGMSSFFPEFTY